MTARTVLRGGRVVTPGGIVMADIAIEGQTILDVTGGESAPHGADILDMTGKVVLPGLIDTHAHLSEPGHAHGRVRSLPGRMPTSSPSISRRDPPSARRTSSANADGRPGTAGRSPACRS